LGKNRDNSSLVLFHRFCFLSVYPLAGLKLEKGLLPHLNKSLTLELQLQKRKHCEPHPDSRRSATPDLIEQRVVLLELLSTVIDINMERFIRV
jgi:hypothetical protein